MRDVTTRLRECGVLDRRIFPGFALLCGVAIGGPACGTTSSDDSGDAPGGSSQGGFGGTPAAGGATSGTGTGGASSGGVSGASTGGASMGGAATGGVAGDASTGGASGTGFGGASGSNDVGGATSGGANPGGTSSGGARGGTAGSSGGAASGGTAGAAGRGESSGASGAAGKGGSGGGPQGPAVAFPGAEGFGANARGGRGGEVCHVTTLADSGAGSLRDCVSRANRTVVFDVSGWINLSSNLGVTQNNITIAGQTAPGGGIGVRGRKFSIGGRDVVVRFLRIRRGILATSDRDDAMSISSAAENVIVDHCSVAFGTDETLSMPGDEGQGPRNLTLQWSIVAWGLQRNNHSAGSLLTSNQTTIHHTLWAFNKTRNPRGRSEEAGTRGQGGHLDWVNNVIYGWNAPDPVGESMGWSISHDPYILAGTSNGMHAANAVGNYFISRRSASYAFHNGTSNFRLYPSNNVLDGNANGMLDSSKTGNDMIEGSPTIINARIASPEVATDTPRAAYDRVMAGVGAILPQRDQADALLVSQVQAQTGNLIQSEQDLVALGVGDSGYGTLAQATRPAGFDTDLDGMPNAWESANGLNPNDAADRNGDTDADGYTNLEEYLNSLVS
ncbi:MAG TPA: pectate lyase [Polyangiaceae bacterium]